MVKTINSEMLYKMLTSSNPDDVRMGYDIGKRFYKGNNDKIRRLLNFYKILSNTPIVTYNHKRGITEWSCHPLGLILDESLILSNKNITYRDLPDNLIIKGSLDLRGNKGLKKLPKGLKVRDYLYVRDTKIKELHESIKIGGISGTEEDMDLTKNIWTEEEIYQMKKLLKSF